MTIVAHVLHNKYSVYDIPCKGKNDLLYIGVANGIGGFGVKSLKIKDLTPKVGLSLKVLAYTKNFY